MQAPWFAAPVSLLALACGSSAPANPPTGSAAPKPAPAPATQPAGPATPSAAGSAAAPAGSATAPVGSAATPGSCDLTSPAGWGACDGTDVSISGVIAKMVSQHPIVAIPAGLEPGDPRVEQGYLDVTVGTGSRQIIVLSAKPLACPGTLEIDGKLRAIDAGGGKPGTKGSYGGWVIDARAIRCR